MKNSIQKSAVVAVILSGILSGKAYACDTIYVQSMNGAPQNVSVGLTLDSVPADQVGFNLAPAATHNDNLPVGTGSPNPMNLRAHVTLGSISADCSTSVTNDSVTGLCSGSVNPVYQLNISYVAGSSTTTVTCKHDNGNHWGEYRKLGLTVPPHSGKPGAACNDHKKCKGCTGGTVTTPPSMSCQFVLSTTK